MDRVSEEVTTSYEETLDRLDRTGSRPGIVGTILDRASGKRLDKAASVLGVSRRPACLFGFPLPWGQSDESLRSRAWRAYQAKWRRPDDGKARLHP